MGRVIITGERDMKAAQLGKPQVVRIAKRMAKHLGVEYKHLPYAKRDTPESWSYEGPRVWPGSHEESHSKWIISCEGYVGTDWAWSEWFQRIVEEESNGAFYAEAGNSWYVGFYPVY